MHLTNPVASGRPLGAPFLTSGPATALWGGVAVGIFLEERRGGGEASQRSGEEGTGLEWMLWELGCGDVDVGEEREEKKEK